ncbi:MAG: choice-of-anchor L domain-containing protein, partial [Chitinophagales bacterium]
MMRVLLLLCIILATSSTADGQIYDMSNNSVTDPSGTLYDSGGSSGHYISNEDYTFTICPPNPCDCLALSFEYLLVDTPGDTLYIHNGSSTAAPLVASLAGFNFPSDLFLDSGCATLRFSSNGGKNSAGWKMTWSCSCFSGEVETNTSAYTTTELIEDLFVSGNCVEVSNISFTGNSDAVGSFSNGGVIGIESGIVLSTGFINNISGPNNLNTSPGTNPFLSGVSDQLGSPGDSDLDILLDGQTTTDASSIEFDFTPTTNEISFRYVFASDEYPEFVCSDYNDVFAFFISGPGFTGSQNIALVPGTTTPVSINSINNSSIGSQGFEENCINLNNSDYYINSTGSLSFEFDGFTTILTATAPVISCEDYHIKLVIADVVDHKYDSAVFLEANSFKAGEGILISSSVTNAHASPNEMYENCESGFFLFERGNSDNTSEPLVIDFEVTGTATAGIDYSPLPSSITIPIGQTSIQIDINSFLDGISESSESIIVTILNNICICEEGSSSAQINILDNPVIEATLPTSDYCLNDLVTLAPNVIGGISPFTYNWSAPYNVSSDLPSISFPLKLNKTGIYHVTVSDDCGNQSTASVNLEIIPIPSIPQITAVAPFCENSDPFNLQVSEVGGTWAGSGIIDTNTGTFDPATAQNISTPPFLITYTLSNYCGTVSNTINLDFTLLPTATISGNLTTCPGTAVEENLSIFFTGEAPWAFTYAVDDIEIASIENITDNPYEFIVNQIGDITLTAMNDNYCDGTFDGLATISEFSIPIATISGGGVLCNNEDFADIDFTIVNGAIPYEVIYTNGTTQFNQQIASSPFSIPVNLLGTYEIISITDANGCAGDFSGMAQVLDTDLSIDSATPNIANCQDNDGSITDVVISGGNSPYDYFWYDDADLLLSTNTILTGISTGNYTLIVIDDLLCSDTLNLSIGELPPPSINNAGIPTASLCSENNGSIIGTIFSGGEFPYSYLWKDSLNNVVGNSLDLFNVFAGNYTLLIEDINGCKDSIEVSIADFPPPNLTGGTANSANCNENNGSITGITIEGGLSPYNYQWIGESGSINNNSLDLLNISSGNYSVTVTDDNGCTQALDFTVQDTESPEINSAITNPSLCSEANGSITDIDITGGFLPFTYEWQDKDGNVVDNKLVLEGVSAGTYTLIVTDIYGCKGLSEYNITNKPSPFLNQGEVTSATCNEENGSITNINIQGDYPPFEYEWTNNSGEVVGSNIALQNVGLGDYTLEATDMNGCIAEIFFSVLSIPFPTLSEGNIIPSTCGNQNGAVQNIEIQGGVAPFTTEWYNEANELIHNTLSLQNISAGNYELIVTDANGCIANTNIEITDIPAPEITGEEATPTTCGNSNGAIQGIQIEGNTTPFTYEWYNASSELLDTTLSLQNLPAGNYEFIVTDANGCTASTNIEITDIPAPEIIGGEVSPSSCGDSDGAITGIEVSGNVGELTYEWQNHSGEILSQTATLSNVPQGSYILTIIDENGCETSENFNISDSTAPQLVGGEIQNATCGEANGSITNINIQNGTALFTFEWQNEIGETINAGEVTMNVLQLENLEEGLYTIFVTDSNDCTVSLQFTIEDSPLPQLSGGTINEATCGEPDGSITNILVEDGILPYTFEWTNASGEVIGNELNIENLEFGNYTLEVADSNNCIHRLEFLIPQISTESFDGGIITPANCGESDGSITGIIIEGNTSFFTFEWTNDAGEIVGNELDIENLESGNYTLTFTDFNTCIHTNNFFVPQTSSSPANGGIIAPANCGEADGSITEINIEGDPTLFSFEWTNEGEEVIGNELDIEGLASGSYTLQITDSNNCTNLIDFFVPQTSNSPANGGLIIPANCGESDGSITEIIIEGDPILFSFEWTNESGEVIGNELDIENLASGSYTLQITDSNNCTHTTDFFVPQTSSSPIDGGLITPANCGESDGSITEINIEGDPTFFSFEWINEGEEVIGNELDIAGLESGSYTLQITDSNNCTYLIDFFVPETSISPIDGGLITPANCGESNG